MLNYVFSGDIIIDVLPYKEKARDKDISLCEYKELTEIGIGLIITSIKYRTSNNR